MAIAVNDANAQRIDHRIKQPGPKTLKVIHDRGLVGTVLLFFEEAQPIWVEDDPTLDEGREQTQHRRTQLYHRLRRHFDRPSNKYTSMIQRYDIEFQSAIAQADAGEMITCYNGAFRLTEFGKTCLRVMRTVVCPACKKSVSASNSRHHTCYYCGGATHAESDTSSFFGNRP